jgi:biotin carboxyl carrier protein
MNEYIVTVDELQHNICLLNDSEIIIDDLKYNYELNFVYSNLFRLKLNNKVYELTGVNILGDSYSVNIGGYQFDVTVRTALQQKAFKLIEEAKTATHQSRNVMAPMPGLILKINRKENELIAQGDSVMILEAMKMENDLKSPASGQIKKIFVNEGTAVEKGAVLFTIE